MVRTAAGGPADFEDFEYSGDDHTITVRWTNASWDDQ